MVLVFLARIPFEATGITLTLHVVSGLDRGYGAAGIVAALITVGTGFGGPLVGRVLDRFGLRPVVAVCTVASTAIWLTAPHLPYYALLLLAAPAGLLFVPIGPLARQIIAALVPKTLRRTAYSLDSMLLELSYIVGPAGVLAVATQLSTTTALTGIAAGFAVTGTTLWIMNPPLVGEGSTVGSGARPRLRSWLTPQLVRAYLITLGALFVLVGMELSLVASLRASGDVEWTSAALAVICVASLVGGLAHGAARRSLSQLRLMVLLAAFTVPVGLFVEPWWLLALALVPSNLACAPTIAATAETVTELAPERVRGEASGLQSSAMMTGLGIGSPVVGFVIDHSSPGWGFAAAGGVGLLVAAVALVIGRRRSREAQPVAA